MDMKWLKKARVPLGMVLVRLVFAGLQLLSRVTLIQGSFIFALLTYRHVVAAICLAPFAYYWERGAVWKLNFAILWRLFLVALTGIAMAIGLFYYGLKDTTATYAMGLFNLVPAVTFLLSLIIRMEELALKSSVGKIKAIGAMLCVAGALVMALYEGKSFHLGKHGATIIVESAQNRVRGTIFLVSSCVAYAMWLILQVKLFKVFPYKYTATMLTCVIGSVQAVVIGLCIDRKPKSWHLGWDLQLITIVYSGILATAASFSIMMWVIANKGPTYPSMFNPISLIIVLIVEAFAFGEAIFVGSMIGMGIIVVGLYSFLWGKNKELKEKARIPVGLERECGGGGGEVAGATTELAVPVEVEVEGGGSGGEVFGAATELVVRQCSASGICEITEE